MTSASQTRGHRAQERLEEAVLSGTGIDLAHFGGLGDVTVYPWMVAELREHEAALRRLREQIEQRLAQAPDRLCVRCAAVMTGRADRRYCSPRCRQAAHRDRAGNG